MQRLRFQWFLSAATGRAVATHSATKQIHQADVDFGDVRQQWLMKPSPDEGSLLIVNRATAQAVDVPGFAFASGTRLQRFPVNRGANQLWVRREPGLFLSSQHQDFAWDVPGGDSQQDLQLFARNGGVNQQWTIDQPPGQVVDFQAFKVRSAAGKVLDVPNGSQNEGAPVQQFADSGDLGFNQFWEILDANFHPLSTINMQTPQVIRLLCVTSGKLLQVAGRPSAPMPVTQGAIASQASGQLWRLEPDGAGVRLHCNSNTDFVLDLPGGSTGDVALQVFKRNGGPNQRWTIV